ncbi:MAG: bis(5'-nucleosyl)-tetraphosphatase (symmetrical) YqeK [Tissierellia bacterium]|nr:bis(5'-nucleosyl)-tetraphosphatase (symmetrical) YqeK [Tissierellia bacterium]
MREKIIKDLKKNLSPEGVSHVLRVEKQIRVYAKLYHVNEEKSCISALFHDFCKGNEKKYQERYHDIITEYVERYDGEEVFKNMKIIHGLYGAIVAEQEYGITDDGVLHAIIFHSTACKDFSNLGKILYLADKLEPNRKYPDVDQLRSFAKKDLDLGFAHTLNHSIEYLIKQRECISIDTMRCRNQLIQEGKFGK